LLSIEAVLSKRLFLPEKKDIFEPDVRVLTMADLNPEQKEELLEGLKEVKVFLCKDQLL